MRKLIFLAVTALLALPALAVAGSPPSPASQAAAVKQCTTERNANAAAFKVLYGTLPNRSNAFGKCVSKLAQQNEQEHSNAAAGTRLSLEQFVGGILLHHAEWKSVATLFETTATGDSVGRGGLIFW